MNGEKYIYAGNRSTVLRRMISLGLDVKHVLPTVGSWLEREMPELGLPFTPVASKKQATDFLVAEKFDVFVSTGFRYILPVTQLRGIHPDAKFVNIHPSFLPDLRGADPIPGAVLFGRDSGVTCHLMDDGIDTGAIVAQRKIPYFDGLDSKLLYKLCFKLEPDVFEEAWKLKFVPQSVAGRSEIKQVYYTCAAGDDVFHESDDAEQLVRRVRAFNTPRRGFQFALGEQKYRAFDASVISHEIGYDLASSAECWQVIESYEDCLLLAKNKMLVKLSGVTPTPVGPLRGRMHTN
ncbi:formyltransferase family protein [Prosthecobacter fluviatilis]|uniref:Formyltransferase family protein n=1 Tax=Prosthecobacter fluviatilis TaxID=445931 RepID=A0ABW0KKE2_9BACT